MKLLFCFYRILPKKEVFMKYEMGHKLMCTNLHFSTTPQRKLFFGLFFMRECVCESRLLYSTLYQLTLTVTKIVRLFSKYVPI